MQEDEDQNFSIRTKSQRLKKQINTWNNRAAMARKYGNADLEQKALDYKRQSENELAKLQEFEVDEK